MATRVWRGDAAAVKQIATLTPGTVEINDVFTVTINGKSVSVIATAATVANVTGLMTTAFNNSAYPEFAEITASDSTTHVTLTADTAGKPFTATTSTTDGGGNDTQTFVYAVTTANAGPNDWSTADNWSGETVPVNSDDVYIQSGKVDILYGLDQSAITLASLTIDAAYTGKIGLPKRNTSGSVEYEEYRDDYLKVGATTITIGSGPGQGSGRIKINGGSVQTTLNVHSTGRALETGIPSMLWLGTHASNVVNVLKGSVGLGFFASESFTIATLRVSYVSNQLGDAEVVCGDAGTLTNVDQSGGKLTIEDNTTAIDQTAGELTILEASTHTAINCDGGTVYYQSTGTATTVEVGNGGSFDCSRDMNARTVTTLKLYAGSSFKDPFKTVTLTNPLQLVRCSVAQLKELDVGKHLGLQRSAI